MNFFEKTIKEEYIYKGKIINLRKDEVELHDGSISMREIVEHNGGVGVVAVNEKKEFILVKQFRKPLERELLEIPAGKLEKGENPLECGIRELEEETGFKPVKMEKMGEIFTAPGFSNEKLYLYFCDEMVKGNVNLDDDENIEVIYVDYKRAIEMIYNGEIKDSKTMIGILMASKFIK